MIEKLIEISIKAGEAIEKVAKDSFEVEVKKDKTPVTTADLASHKLIEDLLSKEFPDIPLLSEESVSISYEQRREWKEYFLVDPLDGTKEFIKQNGQYSVNIAYMVNNHPRLGVIHAPVSKETWFAEEAKGAFKKDSPHEKSHQIHVSKWDQEEVKVAISASHLSQITKDFMQENYRSYETHPIGSSLKFCKIAEGSVHVYPRLGPTSEWDTAAGEIILKEAGGGIVKYEDRLPLDYNKENLINPWFIAFGPSLEDLN